MHRFFFFIFSCIPVERVESEILTLTLPSSLTTPKPTHCKKCPIQICPQLFTSSNTNLSYPPPLTTNPQTWCTSFYIGDTGQIFQNIYIYGHQTCQILSAPFSGSLVCPHHRQTPLCHPEPCLPPIWRWHTNLYFSRQFPGINIH